MSLWTVVWWALMAGGLIPTTWFLVRFRPRWPLRSPSLVVNGLVLIAWIFYMRSAAVIVANGGTPTFRGPADIAIRLGSMVLVDPLLIGLLALFLKYRRRWLDNRPTDVPPTGTEDRSP